MLFNSYLFLFGFLPLALAGWWSLRTRNARLAFLTAASWTFYAWWDWRFLPLMLVSTSIDFLAAIALERCTVDRRRRLLLVTSLTVNLGLLGFFKYAGFFLGSLDGLGRAVGAPMDIPSLDVLLPIGISFYTFNSMSYTIDVFRRRVEPTHSFLEYSAFVALFPHLVAGPIVRYTDLADQLRRLRPSLTSDMAAAGIFFLACGLVKKLVVADNVAPHVDALFGSPGDLGLVSAWAAAVGFSLQLYFDFSGYSDMAVGLAWLLGFRFPQNFNSPFKAANISDFWRRWHMSLSAWIRDYLFIPLGGSRKGPRRTVVNLLITMFLAGLWHGAAWTFVVWGLVHGVLLGGHALLRGRGWTLRSVAVNRVLTFVIVVAAFVIFRAASLGDAVSVLGAMVGVNGIESLGRLGELVPIEFAALLVLLLVFVNFAPNTWEIRVPTRVRSGLVTGFAAALAIMTIVSPQPFVYFQF